MTPIYESMKESFCRDIYRLQSNIIAPPAASVFAGADFVSLVLAEKPQTVFFRLDRDLRVLDGQGSAVGTLYELLSITKSFVPVFCIEDAPTAYKLADFVFYNALGDASICVSAENIELLKDAHRHMPMLRCMLDCRDLAEPTDMWALAGRAWSAGAISVLISASQCSREAVDILHERVLSVWCDANGEEDRVIFEGVDGVITDNVGRFYALLDRLPENSMLDRYRIIAHKGFQDGYTEPENSITAVKKGADYALDGAEIDVKLSTDGIPFVIHNPTTRGILKGDTRPVEDLSSEELDTTERTDFPGEYTDRLEKMLSVMSAYPRFPIYIEFKPDQKRHHIEKMTHAIKGMIKRTGTEYSSVALCTPGAVRYISYLLPTLPKVSGTWEEPNPPKNVDEAQEMLYRLCEKLIGTPAALCVEDVMVNPTFGAVAAIRGINTVVWTRSWYFKHSLWENDGERSDEGFISGFYATISDHAERYFHVPVQIALDGKNEPVAMMRDGRKIAPENATLYELGGGKKVWGVGVDLPHGTRINIFSESFE